MRIIIAVASATLSGFLLYASLPPLDLSLLAWVTLVPLFMVLRSLRYQQAFCVAWLTGVVLYGLHCAWLLTVPGVPVLAFFTIVLYSGVYYGLFGLGFTVLIRRTGLSGVLVAPLLWAAIEFLRSNVAFLSLPFALLGFSQYNTYKVLQLASLTSVYGISCLIVLVNTTLAEVGLWAVGQCCSRTSGVPSRRGVVVASTVTIMSLLLVVLWGHQEVRRLDGAMAALLTTSLIQGNIPQLEKWQPASRAKILQRYRDLTLWAAHDHPDLIIWPEAATPAYLSDNGKVYLAVRELSRATGIPLLLGSASYAKIGRGTTRQYQFRNSVFLLDGQGEVVATYDKMRLLPFGEYLPLQGHFPWPQWLVPRNGNFMAGTTPTIFALPKGRFGVVICWENLFPDLFRRFVTAGAQFMVNPTNEAWFAPAASRQFLAMSVLRAVEHRVTLLRVANTGITSFIDPLGRIQERVKDNTGNDVNVAGFLTVTVPAPMGPTYYTRYGDVFAGTCAGVSVLFLLVAVLPVRVRRHATVAAPQIRYESYEE